jgi:hypothetical protein
VFPSGVIAAENPFTQFLGNKDSIKKIRDFQLMSEGANRAFFGMNQSMKGIAGSLAIAGGAIGLMVEGVKTMRGLLGFGGLPFGIDRIAAATASQRQAAMGLGVSPAERQAFGTDFARFYENPEGVLQNIANAKSDQSQWYKLMALGISANDIQNKDPAQLAIMVSNAVRKMGSRANNELYAKATV